MPNYYKFQQSDLGGGGAIYGLLQNPAQPDILYAKCDVAGIFKSTDRGQSWCVVNHGMTQAHHHQVQSICLHPHKPEILLRATGEIRDDKVIGTLFKSCDAGDSWQVVSEDIGFFGNGPVRYAEVVCFDPLNPKMAAAGSYLDGLFISYDYGDNWRYTGLQGEPIACVAFHPVKSGYLYVSTVSERKIHPLEAREREPKGQLYLSKDFGDHWELLYESDLSLSAIYFSRTNPDIVYLLSDDSVQNWPARNGGILKSLDGGRSFTYSMKGLPEYNTVYGTLAEDPHHPGTYYTTAKRYPDDRGWLNQTHIPQVPIYRSTDECNTWHLLKEYVWNNFHDYPVYIKHEGWLGWDIFRFLVDSENPDILYMTNWYGVSVSHDGGNSWSGHHFKGIETTCLENVVADPLVVNKAYLSLPDHYPLVTLDGGSTYGQFYDTSIYHNSTAVVASKHKPGVMLYSAKSTWLGHATAINRSLDNEKTFERVMLLEHFLTVQALREDPFLPGTFYAYIDRKIEEGAGLYRSDDWGKTWNKMPLHLPAYIDKLPYQQDWIENEVLSVTRGQKKNVCGTNQLLCMDPHHPGTLYFGEWTEGLFRTQDYGKSWKDISPGLPFKKNRVSILMDIKADCCQPGAIYAGFIHEGVWKSCDSGETWEKHFPKDNLPINACSMAIGRHEKELFVASEPMYWSPSESAIWHTQDGGKSWENIYDGSFGALRFKGIALDKNKQTLYAATCGNGAFSIILPE